MDIELTAAEARVLGALIEKELTTPEYYPLTLNGLVTACNQKSNRDPVMELSESDVENAVEGLRVQHLVWRRSIVGARVSKYEHNCVGRWSFSSQEIAVMCVLLLRGAQTLGEIKSRTGRLYDFSSLDEVQTTIEQLMKKDDGPFVVELSRLPGQKEVRFMHCLCGEPAVSLPQSQGDIPQAVALSSPTLGSRVQFLEEEVVELRAEIETLKGYVDQLKQLLE